MPQLVIELSETEHALLTAKAGNCDLQQIVRIALDNYFCTHRHTATNTVPLDLSGSRKVIAALEADRIDLNRPQPPNRTETTVEGRFRWETDADFEDAMRCYRWNLDRYNAAQSYFDEKKRNGTINEFGGISCKL